MKIEKVTAKAFGPFRDAALELAPGMTVVHGPNESGKSSWCAAMYSAICGVRRKKGRGTAKDVDFKNRHQPWVGRAWQVGVDLRLDDGRVLELEQQLGSGGNSSATNKVTQISATSSLLNEGSVDASTLLGLDRDAVPAILFVRQAEILRVLEEVNGLQQYLEKAAASVTVDSTAEEALARIELFQKEKVGLDRRGSRRPLALAKERVQATREARGSAYDEYDAYGQCLTNRREFEVRLNSLDVELEQVRRHEDRRLRFKKWEAFEALTERLQRAKTLSSRIQSGPQGDGPPTELARAVGSLIGAYENRPPLSKELEGISADSLSKQIESLPTVPVGDVRPHEDVTEAHDRWRRCVARASTSRENEPALDQAPSPSLELAEIRRLADELDRTVPEVEATLRSEIDRLESQVDARRESARAGRASIRLRRRVLLGAGVTTGLGAVVAAVLGQFLLAGGLGVVAVALVVLGLRGSGQGDESRGGGTPDSEEGELLRLRARQEAQSEVAEVARQAKEAAKERLVSTGLPADPEALRKLATQIDSRAQKQSTHAAWKQRHAEIETEASEAAHALTEALKRRNAIVGRISPEEDVHVYLRECEARDTQNQQAARRADLEAQLRARRAAEAAHQEERQGREQVDQKLRQVASDLGCLAESVEETVAKLRSWMAEEEKRSGLRRERDENRARLEQLLDGLTMVQLEEQIEATRAELPERPDGGSEVRLEDRSHELEALELRARARRHDVAQLTGEVATREKALGSLAEAIEDELRAEDEYAQVTSLSSALERATEFLTAAKEKAHANIAPVINDMLIPWVRRITKDRYDDVRVDPKTLSLEVHERGGKFRQAQFLSHGTMEQIFLLLRVALSKLLVTTEETAPLIFDDVFVQSDATRTTALLELMLELSRERQIVVFSQEEEVLSWARQHLSEPSHRIVTLKPPATA